MRFQLEIPAGEGLSVLFPVHLSWSVLISSGLFPVTIYETRECFSTLLESPFELPIRAVRQADRNHMMLIRKTTLRLETIKSVYLKLQVGAFFVSRNRMLNETWARAQKTVHAAILREAQVWLDAKIWSVKIFVFRTHLVTAACQASSPSHPLQRMFWMMECPPEHRICLFNSVKYAHFVSSFRPVGP